MNKIFQLGLFILTLTLVGCAGPTNKSDNSSSNAIAPASKNEDTFVNGINQAYLQSAGITEEQFLSKIEGGEFPDGPDLKPSLGSENGKSESSLAVSGGGFFNFSDIVANPGTYFRVEPHISTLPGYESYLIAGFNFEKLNETLKYVNYPIKETTYNRYYIRNVRLNKVTTNAIYLKADIQVKMYTKKPWPLSGIWCTVDKTASSDITVNYSINSATNTIVFSKIGASNITIDRTIWEYLTPFGMFNVVVDFIVSRINVSDSVDQNIELKFLPINYVRFSSMYTSGYFCNMKFKLLIPSEVYTLINLAKYYNVPLSPTIFYTPTLDVSIDGPTSLPSLSPQTWSAYVGNAMGPLSYSWSFRSNDIGVTMFNANTQSTTQSLPFIVTGQNTYGTFTVTLTVSDGSMSGTATQTVYITR